jgi:CRP-like cAMP-binding protein
MLHSKDGVPQTPSVDAGLIWYMQTARSIDDELARAVSGDVTLFGAALLIMCCFCCFILGDNIGCKGCCLHSRMLLGCQGIGLIILSMGAGYGLCSGLDIAFTTLQSILPFILLGIGVDDMLVITTAFDRVSRISPDDPVTERIRKAYARCGPSITLTSVTDFVAFAFGAVSKLPAIRYFCLYAAASVMMTYILMCTAFAAILALDAQRQEAQRLDCLPCFRAGGAFEKRGHAMPLIQRGIRSFAGILLTSVGKVVALTIFFCVLGANCWAWTKTTSGFDIIDLTPDSSYARDYMNLNLELAGSDLTTISFSVYTKAMDYHDAQVQAMYMKLHDDLLTNPKVDPALMRSWYLSFQQFLAHPSILQSSYGMSVDEHGRLTDSATFYRALDAFFDFEDPSMPGVKINANWADDVRWVDSKDPTKGLSAARFSAGHPVSVTTDTPSRIACLEAMEDIAGASELVPAVAIYSGFYMFLDQFRTIYGELMLNFAMCLIAVCVICLLALHHLSVVALTCALIVLVDIDLIGSVYWWGLEVNSISIICLVMAIGLVVDYSAHIVHNFVAIKSDAKKLIATADVAGHSTEAIVNTINIFKAATAAQRLKLTTAMVTASFDDGETIIKQGDEGDAFFIIESGEAQVTIDVEDQVIQGATLHHGAYFGELALLSGCTRGATVTAVGAVICQRLDRELFIEVMEPVTSILALVENVPLFRVLSDEQHQTLADAMTRETFGPGDDIITEGDEGDAFYIVQTGEAQVTVGGRKGVVLHAMSYFGELALLSDR